VADVYISARGFSVNEAVVASALLATLAYSLFGRGVGCPVLGRVSDALLRRGTSRTSLVIASLAITAVSFQLLSMGVTAMWFLWLVAVVLGTTVNAFTLVIAEASEAYGPEKTGSVSSFMNTVGQLIGATALAVSGYIGVGLNPGAKNSLDEYQGIWLSGVAWVVALALLGSLLYYVAQRPAVGRASNHQPARLR
jgi:MFS family permease